MPAQLSFDNVPRVDVPLRFFNTAPWMGVLAGCVLLGGGMQALESQWSSTLLGSTHLLTLGFMTMTMLGALFQLMPVLGGVALPRTRAVATAVHLCLSFGTLLLACGFAIRMPELFRLALPLLLVAFGSFLLALGYLLIRRLGGGISMFSIRLAAVSLLITVVIGLIRAAGYVPGFSVTGWSVLTTDTHLAWGLAGWMLLLIVGVGYQVIPMFHVTPAYRLIPARLVPSAIVIALLLLTLAPFSFSRMLAVGLLCAGMAAHAVCTLWLLGRRRRKLVDVTVSFWRLAMISLLAAAGLLVGAAVWDDPVTPIGQRLNISIGVTAIYGVGCSVIMGMLQKIIPFLLYLHLQRQAMSNAEVLAELPHGRMILPEWCSVGQWRVHLAALMLLVAACWFKVLSAPAALLMICDFAFLGYCIARATRLYIRTQKEVRTALAT